MRYGISLRCTERDDVQPKSETDSDHSQFMRSSERLQAEKMSAKQGSKRLRSRTESHEEVLGGTASSRHYAEVRVRGKQAEGMHGKDFRDSEALKSQKAEVKSVSEKYGPDAEREDEEREQRNLQTRH